MHLKASKAPRVRPEAQGAGLPSSSLPRTPGSPAWPKGPRHPWRDQLPSSLQRKLLTSSSRGPSAAVT